MSRLSGRRILVVEDQYLIAEHMAQILSDLGAKVVGPVGSVSDATTTLELGVDAVLLDIRLADGEAYRLAEILQRRGIPFMFVSGMRQEFVPEQWADVPFLEKPFSPKSLTNALNLLFRTNERAH